MNRAEKRRLGVKRSEPTYTLKQSDIDAIKDRARAEGVNDAFVLMLAIPVMILHDKFGQIMKKQGREERFVDLCLDIYRMYDGGFVDLKDLRECLLEETGIRLEEIRP